MADGDAQRTIVHLSIGLAVAVSVIAFLAGREMGRSEAQKSCDETVAHLTRSRSAPVPTSPVLPPVARTSTPAEGPKPSSPAEPPAKPVPSTPEPVVAPVETTPHPRAEDSATWEEDSEGNVTLKVKGAHESTDPVDVKPGSKARAKAYLDRVRAIRIGPEGASPESFAQALMGDTSGAAIGDLVKDAQRAEAQARALTPPPEAATHHAKLVDVLARTTRLFQGLQAAIAGGDPERLTSILSEATALQTEAEQLATLEAELARKL